MTKRKISATVSPDILRRAREVTGNNNVSDLLERGLDALIERELERRWLDAHQADESRDDLPADVPVDLAGTPWDHP